MIDASLLVSVFFGANNVIWCFKKQTIVTQSSCEAEYRALTITTTEVLRIKSLLPEFHVPFLLHP